MKTFLIVLTASAVLAACGGDPTDVRGEYTVSLTNRENGCESANWTEGDTAAGVSLVITQNDTAVTLDVTAPGARLYLDAVLGGHVFTGSVDGNDIDLLIEGTPMFSRATCDYTVDAQIVGSLDGDVLSGDIFYRAQTDGAVDCGTLTGCASRQEFLGNRPPS